MQNMQGNIRFMFDYSGDPVVHLFLLKSSPITLIGCPTLAQATLYSNITLVIGTLDQTDELHWGSIS